MGDRIETGTFCVVATLTKGDLTIKNFNPKLIQTELNLLKRFGAKIKTNIKEKKLYEDLVDSYEKSIKDAEKQMISAIDEAKSNGDSVGGIFEIIATGCPYGLGSPFQWDRKLQAKISAMMMSVNAFKGIDIGGGMNESEKWGSEVHDEIGWEKNKYIRYFACCSKNSIAILKFKIFLFENVNNIFLSFTLNF